MTRVLFVTNCYSKDLEYLSHGGYEYKMLLNDYPFTEHWIVANLGDKIATDTFGTKTDRVLIRDKSTTIALAHFGFSRDCFVDPVTKQDGHIYSIDSVIELAFGAGFDYICHFCGDVELYKKADWITEGIRKIDEGYVAARPRLPRYEMQVAGEQELTETDIFSDHVYLIHRDTIYRKLPEIFSLAAPSCDDIHVLYGGDSFERKMTRYLKHTGQKIAIIQNAEEIPIQL